MTEPELPLFRHWSEFLKWILGRTEKFPRRVRQSMSLRIENTALDILDDIIAARYMRDRMPVLARINLNLERLRVLMRICHERGFLPHDAYEFGARGLVEAGRMTGGWLKHVEGQTTQHRRRGSARGSASTQGQVEALRGSDTAQEA